MSGLTTWRYLEGLENLAAGSWYWAEKATLSVLALFAIFGVFIYCLKIVFYFRLVTYGVNFCTVASLMNPFAPFLMTMDGNREIIQLHNIVSSVQNQSLLEAVPPKVVKDSFYPTERIVAIQSENRGI